jgi:hypothetical protein
MRILAAIAILGLIGFGLVAAGVVPLPELGSGSLFMRPGPSNALPTVTLKSLSSKYGFLEGSFVISNPNAFPVADAAIRCEVQGPGGTVIHTFDFVINALVPAKGETTISNHKFGFWDQQSSQMICRSISMERR